MADISQDVLSLTNQVSSLLTTVQAQMNFINATRNAAVAAIQSPVRVVSKTFASIPPGTPLTAELQTTDAEFSSEAAVVLAYTITSPSASGYQVTIGVIDADSNYTKVHQGLGAVGDQKWGQPFTIVKGAASDRVNLSVANLSTDLLTNITITIYEVDFNVSAVNVFKSPILPAVASVVAIGPGATREVTLTVAGLQFTKRTSTIFSVSATTDATPNYTLELVTRTTAGADTTAYVTSQVSGIYKDQIPFSIIKNDATDTVVLRITNQDTTVAIDSLDVVINAMEVA